MKMLFTQFSRTYTLTVKGILSRLVNKCLTRMQFAQSSLKVVSGFPPWFLALAVFRFSIQLSTPSLNFGVETEQVRQ